MFATHKTTICKEDIESLLLEIEDFLADEEESQDETFAILCAVSERAGWNIDTILSNTIVTN